MPDDESPWTLDSLRSHLEARMSEQMATMTTLYVERDRRYQQRYEAQQEALRDALAAVDRATSKAEMATERRFESVNAFRAQLTDQAATFMTRSESEVKNTALSEKLETAVKGIDTRLINMSQISDGRLNALVASIAAIASRIDRNDGRSTGLSQGWGILVGAIGLLLTIVSIGGAVAAFVGR